MRGKRAQGGFDNRHSSQTLLCTGFRNGLAACAARELIQLKGQWVLWFNWDRLKKGARLERERSIRVDL